MLLMDLIEWKYISIAKLTTFKSPNPTRISYWIRTLLPTERIIPNIVFHCQITLKLFILCSKLSALHFAYAQRSYRNRYFPGEKKTHTKNGNYNVSRATRKSILCLAKTGPVVPK